MADIDKSLPNVETEIKIPSDEEVTEVEQETIEEQVGPEDIDIVKKKMAVLQLILIQQQLINLVEKVTEIT